MNHPLERARILAEIARLYRQKSEANINAIYLGITADDRVVNKFRNDRIAELHRQLDGLDESLPADLTQKATS